MTETTVHFESGTDSSGSPRSVAVSEDDRLPVLPGVARLISVNLSSDIKKSNEFQVVQPTNRRRMGGMIQNHFHNSHPMWVFIGPLGGANKSASFYMRPGDPPFTCNVGQTGVLTDEICIVGIAKETFFAIFQ